MSNRVVYLNGQFVPEAEAKLSIYDLSVMQAAAAFEMVRSFNQKYFKLAEHLHRLEASCQLLSLPLPVTRLDLEVLCYAVSERNDHGPDEEHRLLIVVSPGCAPIYRDLDGVIDHPYVYLADFPLRSTVAGFGNYFTEGVHCSTSAIQQVPDACVPSRAKHRSRGHFHLAQQRAPAGTWPLLRDGPKVVVEAPGANLVAVVRGEVWCQYASCLDGISMQTVQALTQGRRRMVEWARGQKPDELWLTGTPFCMLPVVSLDGRPIGDGQIGPVFKDTLRKWNDLVGLDIAGQIQQWDVVASHS